MADYTTLELLHQNQKNQPIGNRNGVTPTHRTAAPAAASPQRERQSKQASSGGYKKTGSLGGLLSHVFKQVKAAGDYRGAKGRVDKVGRK